MKKIISLLAAGALALGLIGCSGDLHDNEAIDMSAVNIVGSINGWKFEPLTEAADGSYWYYEFTADKAENNFTLIGNTDWGGPDAYRGDTTGKFIEEMKVGTKYATTKCDNPSCPAITLVVGTPYTVKAVPAEGGVINVTVEAGETPPTLYVLNGSSAKEMTLAGEGVYTCEYTTAAEETSFEFKVFDGTDSYGVIANTTVEIDKKVSLVKAANSKAISVTGLKAEKAYLITVDYTNLSVKVEKSALKVYLAGADPLNWSLTDEEKAIRMNQIGDTVFYYYEFKAADTSLMFKVATATDWNKAYTNNDEEDGKVTTAVGAADWATYDKANAKNAKITGLTKDDTYTIVADLTTDTAPKVRVFYGAPKFVVGDEFGSWFSDGTFNGIMTNTAKNTWTYTWKATKTNPLIKIEGKLGEWDDSMNWGLASDAEITLDTEFNLVAAGSSSNIKPTLTVGSSYTLTFTVGGTAAAPTYKGKITVAQ